MRWVATASEEMDWTFEREGSRGVVETNRNDGSAKDACKTQFRKAPPGPAPILGMQYDQRSRAFQFLKEDAFPFEARGNARLGIEIQKDRLKSAISQFCGKIQSLAIIETGMTDKNIGHQIWVTLILSGGSA